MITHDPFVDGASAMLTRLTGRQYHTGIVALVVYSAIIIASALILVTLKTKNLI